MTQSITHHSPGCKVLDQGSNPSIELHWLSTSHMLSLDVWLRRLGRLASSRWLHSIRTWEALKLHAKSRVAHCGQNVLSNGWMETFEKNALCLKKICGFCFEESRTCLIFPYVTFLAPTPYDSRDWTDSTNLATSGLRNRKSELTILASSVPTVAVVWSPCVHWKALWGAICIKVGFTSKKELSGVHQ